MGFLRASPLVKEATAAATLPERRGRVRGLTKRFVPKKGNDVGIYLIAF